MWSLTTNYQLSTTSLGLVSTADDGQPSTAINDQLSMEQPTLSSGKSSMWHLTSVGLWLQRLVTGLGLELVPRLYICNGVCAHMCVCNICQRVTTCVYVILTHYLQEKIVFMSLSL